LPEHRGRLRDVVVCDGEEIVGVLQVNTSLRHATEAAAATPTLRDIASQQYTVVRENDIVYEVIRRMWHGHASMALVVSTPGLPTTRDVVGVITKDQVADSVAGSIDVYASGD